MVGIGHNGGDRLNSRLLPLMLAVGTLVTLGGAGFVSAGGPGLVVGSAIASAGSGSCAVPQTPAAAASAPKWVGTPAANRAKNALDQKIEHRFGDYTMIGQREMLSRGLIGMTRDLAQRVVVLVDPAGMVNEAAFEAELQQTSHTHHQHHPNDPMIEARVQEACHSSAELIRASAVITGRGWHPRAADAAYSSFLEPADATFHVTFQDSDRDVGEALEKKLGPLVTVDYTPGPPVQLDSCPLPKNRGHDCEQHWGGARIDIDGDGRGAICSVGFTVNTQNDGQAMTTAGHCFTGDPGWFESVVGDDIVTDTHEHSFGSVQRNLCPDVDVALINASNQGYNDNVYHNEYSPADDPLDVSDGQNSAVGDYICVGAGFSRSYCELEVTDLYGTLCLAICYDTSLMVTRSLDNFDHTQGGDSGSPMYTWLGNHAEINGMYLGQDTAFNGVTYSHRISTIESYLNVETATTNNWQAPS